jgi:glycosyltransferase involved in cell wall biosynthesis
LSRWAGRIHTAGGVFEEREQDGAVAFHHQMVYEGRKTSSVVLRRTRIAYPESHCILLDRQLLPDNDLFDDMEPFDADLGLTLRKRGLTAFLEPRAVDAETWVARNRRFRQKWACTYDGAPKQLAYRRQLRKLGLARWYPNRCTVWMYNVYLGPLTRLRRSVIGHFLLGCVASLSSPPVSRSAVSARVATGAHSPTVTTAGEERLHVLIVSNHWEAQKQSPSAAVYVDRQVASLRDRGVQISTFDLGSSHSPWHIVRQWFELCRHIRRLTPHLIHGQYGTLVGLVSVLAGRPTVLSFCGGDLLPGSSVSALRMRCGFLLSNLAALRARRLICKSEELRQALWWCRHKAMVIPNGVDLTLFTPGPKHEARQALGWNAERPIVLLNGAGDPQRKGVDLVEAAMAVTRSQVPEAALHIVTHVEPTHMPVYYRAADVFLCASKFEGSPNAVKEALACNLPIVSVPVGDVPALLAGVSPSAIVPRDANAIGEALANMLLLRARSNGRERIGHLSLDQVAQQVLAVYDSCHASSLRRLQ